MCDRSCSFKKLIENVNIIKYLYKINIRFMSKIWIFQKLIFKCELINILKVYITIL